MSTAPQLDRRQLRDLRSSTRRSFKQPRPAMTSDIRKRVWQYRANIKAAQLAGRISARCHHYLELQLSLPSVHHGQWGLVPDERAAELLNYKDPRTIRRHRREAERARLVEVQGHGKDHQPCAVRPILRDGQPVYSNVTSPPKPTTTVRPSRTNKSVNLPSTNLRSSPLPPSSIRISRNHPRWSEAERRWRQCHGTTVPQDREFWEFPTNWITAPPDEIVDVGPAQWRLVLAIRHADDIGRSAARTDLTSSHAEKFFDDDTSGAFRLANSVPETNRSGERCQGFSVSRTSG